MRVSHKNAMHSLRPSKYCIQKNSKWMNTFCFASWKGIYKSPDAKFGEVFVKLSSKSHTSRQNTRAHGRRKWVSVGDESQSETRRESAGPVCRAHRQARQRDTGDLQVDWSMIALTWMTLPAHAGFSNKCDYAIRHHGAILSRLFVIDFWSPIFSNIDPLRRGESVA